MDSPTKQDATGQSQPKQKEMIPGSYHQYQQQTAIPPYILPPFFFG